MSHILTARRGLPVATTMAKQSAHWVATRLQLALRPMRYPRSGHLPHHQHSGSERPTLQGRFIARFIKSQPMESMTRTFGILNVMNGYGPRDRPLRPRGFGSCMSKGSLERHSAGGYSAAR